MVAALSLAQVSEHSSKKDIYVAVHNKVYNVTDFIEEVSPARLNYKVPMRSVFHLFL
jgi:hypothetical protein